MNPYAPGQPADPDSFAGRREVLSHVNEAIESARRLGRSSALLLHGYRGSGKTSVLRKVRAEVRSQLPEAIVVEIPLRGNTVEDRLFTSIVAEVSRELQSRSTIGNRLGEVLRRVSEITVGGMGVGFSPGSPGPGTALSLWRELIASFEGVPLLLVLIDDAEQLDDSGMGALKTIAEAHSPTPILLVVTGGLEFSDKLSQHDASPVARIFSGSKLDIGEFSEAETNEALDAPLHRVGSTSHWTDDGVALVHALSRGYPYLVQCVAYATFRESSAIGVQEVQAKIGDALEVGSSWLHRECQGASDEDIVAFAKIASTGKSHLRSSEIRELGIQSQYIGRLVTARILLKISHGHYELRKAPVVAYYHVLRRQLGARVWGPPANVGAASGSP